MSDDLQQRLQAIQDGFLSSREVIKSQDFLIEQLRTELKAANEALDNIWKRPKFGEMPCGHLAGDTRCKCDQLRTQLQAANERIERLKKQQDVLLETIERDQNFWNEDKQRIERLEAGLAKLKDLIDWREIDNARNLIAELEKETT